MNAFAQSTLIAVLIGCFTFWVLSPDPGYHYVPAPSRQTINDAQAIQLSQQYQQQLQQLSSNFQLLQQENQRLQQQYQQQQQQQQQQAREQDTSTCADKPFVAAFQHASNVVDYTAPKAVPGQIFTRQECQRIIETVSYYEMQSGEIEETDTNGQKVVEKNQDRRTRGFAVGKDDKNFQWVYDRLVDHVVRLNAEYWKYNIASDFRSSLIEHIQVQLYNYTELGHYDWHQDVGVTGELATRRLSITVQLSDERTYEGGDLMMKGSATEVSMDRIQGSVIVFPSYMVHKVAPVTAGVRYSMAVWFQEPPPVVFPTVNDARPK